MDDKVTRLPCPYKNEIGREQTRERTAGIRANRECLLRKRARKVAMDDAFAEPVFCTGTNLDKDATMSRVWVRCGEENH